MLKPTFPVPQHIRDGTRGNDPCTKLCWDPDYGYWVYVLKNGMRYQAKDVPWPNHARYTYDRRPGEPKENPDYEPYPLPLLAKALRCSNVEVLEIIGRYGEFYRKKR